MPIYAEVDPLTDEFISEDEMGEPPANSVNVYHIVPARFNIPRPGPHHRIKWIDGDRAWYDPRSIAQIREAAIVDIDISSDAARLTVVGDAARIKEYERAQAGAESYRDAGFSGPVPAAVASWAHAKRRDGWTTRQAAEDILAASARWYAALDGIRALRLDAKEGMRAAITKEEVATTAATFRASLTAAMQGVQ